jgi:hypothetical protein
MLYQGLLFHKKEDIFDMDEIKGKLDYEPESRVLCRWVAISMTRYPSQRCSLIRLCTLGQFDNYRLHDLVLRLLAL